MHMTTQSHIEGSTRALSAESQHGLALNSLQGFEPTPEFLEVLADLDAGLIDEDQALARAAVLARRG
jgi:hypothetical protein